MQIVLFEPMQRLRFLPLVFALPFSHLRMGIFTFQERWELLLQDSCAILAPSYLACDEISSASSDFLYLNPQFIPNAALITHLQALKNGEVLRQGTDIIAAKVSERFTASSQIYDFAYTQSQEYTAPLLKIEQIWDLLKHNAELIALDFALLPVQNKAQYQQQLECTQVLGDQIYIEAGAKVLCSTLNSTTGPIYIGKDAVVMENSSIRGPFALGTAAELKMGTRIYGGTTIGPFSKIGGEVNHSIIQGFSNKGHDGFLGSSLVGQWCNLGAATNNSNLKNNYKSVDIYNYEAQRFIATDLQFLGLIMGDHAKTGIGTMFTTGTVVGIHTNIFGSDFQDKYIPSFSWGGKNTRKDYLFSEAIKTAAAMMARRNVVLDEKTKKIFQYLYEFRENPTFGINFAEA